MPAPIDAHAADAGNWVAPETCRIVLVQVDVGADATWRTADDVALSGQSFVIDTRARRARIDRALVGPGADERWGTDDDVVGSWTDHIYEGERESATITYTMAGPDALWASSDDIAGYWIESERETAGVADITYWIWRNAGPDALVQTGDDPISTWWRELAEPGTGDVVSTLESAEYGSAGRDAMWRTSDDVLVHLHRLEHYRDDTNRQDFMAAGPDGEWRTDDDRITGYWRSQCVTDLLGTMYRDPGPDGAWHTSDDVIGSVTTVPLNECGFFACLI